MEQKNEEQKTDEYMCFDGCQNKERSKLNRIEVTEGHISEVVSMMSGIPINKISLQETKKLVTMDKELTGRVIGQDDAVIKVVKAIKAVEIIKNKHSVEMPDMEMPDTEMPDTEISRSEPVHALNQFTELSRSKPAPQRQ